MSQMFAFSLLMVILYIGDVVSIKTKAWIPSVFVCGVLFILGYWTIFPQNIVEVAGIPTVVATLLMYLLITNMGTLLSVKELVNQWKTIVIALSGILGIIALLLAVGTFVFDLKTVLVAIPPLVGGLVSSLVMSGAEPDVPKLFEKVPKRYHTDYSRILRLALVATLAYYVSVWTAPFVTISPFVLCLCFGVIATSLGFLEKQPLQKANSFGFAILGLMLFVFDGLKQATPEMLMDLFLPMIGIIVIGVIGMYIFSAIVGRVLGVSKEMAFAVSLTALYGFPADYIITNEVIQSLTEDEQEQAALTSHLMPPMLVAGFVTVTIVSVILAGIFSSILLSL